MKAALSLILGLLLLGGCAPPPEPSLATGWQPKPLPRLSGTLSGERVISGEVVLAADLRIPFGSILRAEPGTSIFVLPADSTKIDPERLSSLTEIQVEGELLLNGLAHAPVRILPLKPLDDVAETDPLWAGIEVLPGGRVALEHVFLARAEHGLTLFAGQAKVVQSRFARCRYGLMVQGSGRVVATGLGLIRGEVGLFCRGGQVRLDQAVVLGNDEEGLLLSDDCVVDLGSNRIEGNGIGLVSREDRRFGQTLVDNQRDWQPAFKVRP